MRCAFNPLLPSMQQAEEKAREQEKLMLISSAATGQKSKTGGKETSRKHKDDFNPKPGSIHLYFDRSLKTQGFPLP